MCKKLIIVLFIFFCGIYIPLQAQDTLQFSGFSDYKSLADTICTHFLTRKPKSIKPYFPPDTSFKKKWKAYDSTVNNNILDGQYWVFRNKSEKSFKKAYKAAKKAKYNPAKWIRDTFMVLNSVSVDGQIQEKFQVYFSQKKKKASLRCVIWKIDNKWFIRGDFEFYQNK